MFVEVVISTNIAVRFWLPLQMLVKCSQSRQQYRDRIIEMFYSDCSGLDPPQEESSSQRMPSGMEPTSDCR